MRAKREKSVRRWRGERKESLAIESLFVQTPPVTVTGERSEQDTLTQLHTRYSHSNSSQKGGKVMVGIMRGAESTKV